MTNPELVEKKFRHLPNGAVSGRLVCGMLTFPVNDQAGSQNLRRSAD